MSIYSPITKRTTSILLASMLAALSGAATAQNALGNGRALDANPGQNGTRNYQQPNFADELKFRNSIATGNAPGGLSFRGDIGYRAPGEFSGSLGSDSIFAFRRDSLYSGLAGMGIRGTDALQYQFALTTGAVPPKNLTGNLSLSRDHYYPKNFTTNPQSRSNLGPSDTVIGLNRSAMELDQRGKQLAAETLESMAANSFNIGSMLGTLRTTSTYATTSSLQPALLSVYPQGIDQRPIGLIASPLLGITATPMWQEEPPKINPLVARPSTNIDPAASRGVSSAKLTTSYDGLVDEMREFVEGMRTRNELGTASTIKSDETNDEWLVRQMQELREKLYGITPETEQDPSESDDPNAANPTGPTDPSTTQQTPSLGPDLTDPTAPIDPSTMPGYPEERSAVQSQDNLTGKVEIYDPTVMAVDQETLEVLRGAAAKEVRQLFDPGADQRNIYAEHMKAGQEFIKSGRYFDAEERFTHALAIRPRDISSQIGRLHAQIGAGMVLSASVNFQSLFSQHPEIIASRYAGDLLPGPQRVESLITRLKERAGITHPEFSTRLIESDSIRVSASLLLAYLSYQTDDRESLNAALAMINEVGTDADRRFASLIAQVWIGDPSTDQRADPKPDPMPATDPE